MIFSSFGTAIPPFKARDALYKVFENISAFVEAIPELKVYRNQYKYHAENGVSISMSASNIETMTWGQLNEIFTGLACFMTGINPVSGPDQNSHYQELVFSVYIRKVGYLGSGSIQYKDPNRVAVEKREATLSQYKSPKSVATDGLPQLPAFNDSSNQTSALSAEIPFQVPDTPVTLVLMPLTARMPVAEITIMLLNARSKIASSVAQRPNARISRNWFEYSTTFGTEGDVASVIVHAYVQQQLSWQNVDDVITGLIHVASLGHGKFVPAFQFEVDLEGIGEIGLGKIRYGSQFQSISERSTPPAASTLSENGNIAQHSNGSLSPPGPPNPLADQTHIRFPIINSSITLIFTETGNIRIPINMISDFFPAVLQDIQPSVKSRPNHPITPHLWFFKYENRADGAILSISIYTRRSITLSWLQLYKLLTGLEVFISVQRTPLVFDIDINNNGAVAEGLVWYTPPRLLDGSVAVEKRATISTNHPLLQLYNDTGHPLNSSLTTPPSSTTRLTAQTSYPVPFTPVTLQISTRAPLIPRLYVEACLTSALRHISHNVNARPNQQVTAPSFSYFNSSDVGFTYLPYRDSDSLTWKQLSWVLQGMLQFVNEHRESCKAMTVEIDIEDPQGPGTSRFGVLMLMYAGDEPGMLGQNLARESEVS